MRIWARAFTSDRRGMFRWGLLLLMLVACQRPDPDRRELVVYDVTVELAGLHDKDGPCGNAATGGWGDMFRADEARDAERPTYLMRIWPGAVMMVNLDGLKVEDPGPDLVIEYRGDEAEPLKFSVHGPVVRLNGKNVALSLARADGHQWLSEQPASSLDPIRTVRLAGDGEGDAAALKRFAGRETLVHLDDDYTGLGRADVREALVAVRPRGLVATLTEDRYPLLARLDRLEFLMLTGPVIPPAASLPNLRILLFQTGSQVKDIDSSFAELAKMKRLSSLLLAGKKEDLVIDASRLQELQGLVSLFVLAKPEGMTDLSAVSHLTDLRFLCLGGTKQLKEISHLRGLPKLVELVLLELPDELEDLSPIGELPDLRTFVTGKDDLRDRKEDIALLKKKNPDLEVFGFCLGSAWILVVVPVGALGAALLRRRRKRAA